MTVRIKAVDPDARLARELQQVQEQEAAIAAAVAERQLAEDEAVARELASVEWPELPKPSLGSSLPPKPFVPTRREPPASRAMSKGAQRRANARAQASCDGQSSRTGKA